MVGRVFSVGLIPRMCVRQSGEEIFKKEAKRALTAQLLAHPSAEQVPGYRAHTEAFRR